MAQSAQGMVGSLSLEVLRAVEMWHSVGDMVSGCGGGGLDFGIFEVCSNSMILSRQSHCFQCHHVGCSTLQPPAQRHEDIERVLILRHQGEHVAPNLGVCLQASQAWNLWAPLGKTCWDPTRHTGTGCPRRCGCPIPAGIQAQAGCGSGQPGLLVGDPAHSRGLEPDEHCGPFQPRAFCDSTIV